MKSKKLWGAIILALLLVVFGVLSMKFTSTKKTEVNAQTVQKQDLTETVSASGRVQPKSKVNITAEVSGKVIALPVKEGDTVSAGDLLVQLDTVQAKSDLDQARYTLNEINARLAGEKTALSQSQEEFDRQKQLFQNKLTPEAVFNNAQYAYESAKSSYDAMTAQAKQSQARYEKALDNLKKTTIRAPMDGIITLVDVEVGEIAAAQTAFTQGKTLVTISNLNVFEVEVEVDETEVAKVTYGQPVKIAVDAFPDTTFPGSVVEIGNTAIVKGAGTQDQSTNFKVTVVFEGSEIRVRPGMSATVDITTAERKDILTVPYSAVVVRAFNMDSLKASREAQEKGITATQVRAAETTGDSLAMNGPKDRKEIKGIFVIRQGKAEFVEIQTGVADQKNIEVTSGVQSGDSIIAGPYRVLRTIRDGELVKATQEQGPDKGKEQKS